jgi:hypothetical protein
MDDHEFLIMIACRYFKTLTWDGTWYGLEDRIAIPSLVVASIQFLIPNGQGGGEDCKVRHSSPSRAEAELIRTYLTAQTIHRRIVGRLKKMYLQWKWKESGVAFFKVLSQDSFGVTGESHENPQSG